MDGARHVTTLMCAAHRQQVPAGVRTDLAGGQPVRLVATSLIEAGVDVDFPEVWRAATGPDPEPLSTLPVGMTAFYPTVSGPPDAGPSARVGGSA